HHQEDRAGAGQDGADQAQIHPAPREKEGGLTVKLFKGHYTREALGSRKELPKASYASSYSLEPIVHHGRPIPSWDSSHFRNTFGGTRHARDLRLRRHSEGPFRIGMCRADMRPVPPLCRWVAPDGPDFDHGAAQMRYHIFRVLRRFS
ncbi:MAG: hypothetical protein ACREYE_08965, partial [Gammaproteobacteria bacterium]